MFSHNPFAELSVSISSGDIDIARRATDDLKMAVAAFRDASHAHLTELGEEQLSLARKLVTALTAAAQQ